MLTGAAPAAQKHEKGTQMFTFDALKDSYQGRKAQTEIRPLQRCGPKPAGQPLGRLTGQMQPETARQIKGLH